MDKISGHSSDKDNNIAELKSLHQNEPVASLLNTELLELSPGYAKVAMKLLPDYQNFNGMVFGGVIMALADQAFAYATNSVTRPNIATQFNIHFISAAGLNDKLTAECRVIKEGRRVCISEITVTNQEGKLIAKATGTTMPVKERNK